MIVFLELPPYLGRTDKEAEARLAAQREDALRWMQDRGIDYLGAPPIDSPLSGDHTGFVRSTTEGI